MRNLIDLLYVIGRYKFFIYFLFVACINFSLFSMDMFSAVEGGDLEKVVEIINENKEFVNKQYVDGDFPLLQACRLGNLKVVEALFFAGAKIGIRDKIGRGLIYLACEKEDLELIKFLVKIGANINKPDIFGITPLNIACSKENIEIVKFLLISGVVIDIQSTVEAESKPEINFYLQLTEDMEKSSGDINIFYENGQELDSKAYTFLYELSFCKYSEKINKKLEERDSKKYKKNAFKISGNKRKDSGFEVVLKCVGSNENDQDGFFNFSKMRKIK